MKNKNDLQMAVFGSGCFWCAEAIFSQLKGVESVTPGYAGGHKPNPTYQQVCSDTTGHAEVVRIISDPAIIRYTDLLEIFWQIHDPTTPNRQGNDIGSQYRSIILYVNEEQKQIAQKMLAELEEHKTFPTAIVTEIQPLQEFYPAEDYHKEYYFRNKAQPYCQFVISPKLEKFKKKFEEKLA
ncbi:MAG: peptide-methionine (S)-S-oxide reductase [Anaerolineaceae bacterium]|jgi:peptide-methionine (S)-S-oxide reductase|nr:MAG: peptide-methionine (S)-S-oxide reductase [Anaerolineaceae bacterium]